VIIRLIAARKRTFGPKITNSRVWPEADVQTIHTRAARAGQCVGRFILVGAIAAVT